VYCYCCDRRLSANHFPCSCSDWYCRRCILCAAHCSCPMPALVRDEDLGDEVADDCRTVPAAPDA